MKDLKKDNRLDEHNEMEIILMKDDEVQTSKERYIKYNDGFNDCSGINHEANENKICEIKIQVSVHFNSTIKKRNPN